MKKIFTFALVATIGFAAFSCDDRNNDQIVTTDNDTYPVMKDITGSLNNANDYTISQGLAISGTDVVLVYRNINSDSPSTTAVWQQIPKTEFVGAGRELDYNFLFNTTEVRITTEANFDQALFTPAEANQYITNQRFRIVLVPADQAKNTSLDYSDYNSVIKYYNIPDQK